MNRATTMLLALLCAAQGNAADIELIAATGVGVIHGVAKEFVYDLHNSQSYTLSELDWALQSLLTANAAVRMRGPGSLSASLEVRLGVPWKTGSITDSDWNNVAYNGDQTRTNFSQHDCYTERAILVDAKAGWEIPLASWVTLEPFLAFGFMDFKWSARDGYLQYPPGWFSGSSALPYPDALKQPEIPVSGTVIIYHQTYFFPAVGLAAKFRTGATGGSISFMFSPLVYCDDLDNHEIATPPFRYDYYDSLGNGILFEPRISMEWQIGRGRLSLDFSYRHIEGLIGDTSRVQTGVGYAPGRVKDTFPNGAGASYDAVNVSLGYAWTP